MEIERITDTDERSLDKRVSETLQRLGDACVVQRFTHWYTGRQPVHEARILAR
jgi:hypothetical protein